MNRDIRITDIYWDRMYLHIALDGTDLFTTTLALVNRFDTRFHEVKVDEDTKEYVINITNLGGQEMLDSREWFVKYPNESYEEELAEYKKTHKKMPKDCNEDQWLPRKWSDVPVDPCCFHKMRSLDKVFRYGGNAYAYVFSISPMYDREQVIASICSMFMVKHQNPKKRAFSAESEFKFYQFKKWLIYVLEQSINLVYQIFAHLIPKKGDHVLLLSETRDMGGNLKALDDRIKERGLDKQFHMSYYFQKTLESSRPKIFMIWLKLAILAAKQDYIFVDDYCPFFKYVNLVSKTKLIQVWHAGVGYKSVGYARFGVEGSPYPFAASHRKYDHVIVGGEALRDVYAEVFGIDREACLPYGLMRIDGYMDPEKIAAFKGKFYEEYPHFKDKKIILFAPTYRGSGQRLAYYPYHMLDQEKIKKMCGDEYVFVIKMHPFILEKMAIGEDCKDCIFDLSSFPDINSLFYVTEILITDYSSNIYEFSLHHRPIISFAYDKEEYEMVRSVHRTLDKYAPGKVCTTFDQVIECIEKEDFEMEKLEKFVADNFDQTEGYATDKVIDHILLKK